MTNYLYEDQVVDAVINYLTRHDYRIIDFSHAGQKGDDIIAQSSDKKKRVYIEAKGGTSSKGGTSRFGKPFTKGQVTTHVSVAVYRAIDMKYNRKGDIVLPAIALPKDENHLKVLNKIEDSLSELNIELFLVNEDLSVERAGYWKNFP